MMQETTPASLRLANEVPKDIFEEILSHLSLGDINNLLLLNKGTNKAVIENPRIWEQIYRNHFGDLFDNVRDKSDKNIPFSRDAFNKAYTSIKKRYSFSNQEIQWLYWIGKNDFSSLSKQKFDPSYKFVIFCARAYEADAKDVLEYILFFRKNILNQKQIDILLDKEKIIQEITRNEWMNLLFTNESWNSLCVFNLLVDFRAVSVLEKIFQRISELGLMDEVIENQKNHEKPALPSAISKIFLFSEKLTFDIINLLLKHKFPLAYPSDTVLHTLASTNPQGADVQRAKKLIQEFIKFGGKELFNKKNLSWRTPLELAEENGNQTMKDLLEEATKESKPKLSENGFLSSPGKQSQPVKREEKDDDSDHLKQPQKGP